MIFYIKNILFSYVLILICINISFSQEIFEGKIKGYDGKTADIITGMAEPIKIGEIDADGYFSIPLNDDFINQLKSSVQAESDDDQWSVSLMTLDRAFGNCNNETVKISNGDQPLIKLSLFNAFDIVNLEEKHRYGSFMATSSREYAEAIGNYEHGNDQVGYFIDWYYFEEPAKVSGSCVVKSYTLTQKEDDLYEQVTNYDLEFDAGWNLVKFGNTELYEDSQGKKYAKEKIYQTINKMPKGIGFIYFPE